jgi:large subunit ribosomal protein L10
MPSRETLLGRMVGSLMSPVSGMARLLDAIAKDKAEKEGAPEIKEEEVKKEEKVEEAPKTEEVKAETPTEEKKEEAKKEEK